MWACPNCKKLVGQYVSRCPSCGTLTDPTAPDPVRNKLLALVFLVLLFGAGYGYWRTHRPSPSPSRRVESRGAAAPTRDR